MAESTTKPARRLVDTTASLTQDWLWDSFALHLRAKNRSPATLVFYRNAIRYLLDYLVSQGMPHEPAKLRREHIESYIVYELEPPKSPVTALGRFKALQQVFKFLVDEGELKVSPMARMEPPEAKSKPRPVIGPTALEALFRVCSGTSFDDRRDTAIIRLLMDTGLRRAAFTCIAVNDVDQEQQLIRNIVEKGNEHREVPYGQKAARDLDRYLRVRRKHPRAALPQLWIGHQGALHPNAILLMLKRRAHQAGIDGSVYPHLFRHFFAAKMKEAGASDEIVMQLGGWRTTAMLRHYGKDEAQKRAVDAHRKLSPGDRI